MKTLISLLTDESQRPFPSQRPLALVPVAGSTVLGHLLRFLLEAVPQLDLTLLVAADEQTAVADWLAATLPDVAARLVPAAGGLSTTAVLRTRTDLLDDAPLLLVDGLPMVEAAFDTLPSATADVVELVDGDEPVGMVWLRHGRDLAQALSTGTDDLAGLPDALAQAGRTTSQMAVSLALHARDEAALFHANQHLLGLGYGSQDAIERSYAEDFTVIPPVFIDATAVIDNCVLGPYASIGAGAVVTDSFVRNSIVDAGSELTLVFLDGALIGRNVVAHGRAHALRADDDTQINLTE